MDWNDYIPFDPGVSAPLGDLPRKDARAAFDLLMESRSERREQLLALAARNGVSLSGSADDLQKLNDWFRTEVEAGDTYLLRPVWYSVINDVALYLGDLMIDRHPHLTWTFLTKPKSSASYQRHVLTGFAGVANPNYVVDIDLAIATYAHRCVGTNPVEQDEFVAILDDVDRKA